MIPIKDAPEAIHIGAPILRIDMTQMGPDEIRTMLEQSRDGFYSNKILAPIREYATNARDAHIEAGIPNRPIEITLPSQLSPELRIRDFGKGLTFEQIADVYFRYWKSTKRSSNDTNGCLGIGAKSAFAYTAVYTVTTWCEGMKTVVTGQKDGFADVIFRNPNTNGEPDGVEIVIPVLSKDVDVFIKEALNLFQYWDVRPIFHNIDEEKVKAAFSTMDSKPFLFGEDWEVRPAGYGAGDSRAVMGFIPYTIDWYQVRNGLAPEINVKIGGIFEFLRENLTILRFDNGTLSFTPNRESLQYNDVTIKAISDKLVSIYESLLNLISDKIKDAPNLWEAKIRYNRIFRRELDGFEKNELYAGSLSTIENILRNRIEWRGIVLKNGLFEDLDEWDKDAGQRTSYYDNLNPLFTIFVKDADGNVKACRPRRRHSGANSKIIASPKSVILIQDTDRPSFAKTLAHWYLFKSSKGINQVYVLDLSNVQVKDAFIKEYNFETVPVTYVSQNIALIQAYRKSIRAPRQAGTGEKRPLYCPYVEIKDRHSTSSYVITPSWGNEDVNARDMEEGGVYVVYTKNSFSVGTRTIEHDNSNYFWQAVYQLAKMAGADLPKVYGIHPRTAESVWFTEAVKEGEWISLEKWIADNADQLPVELFQKIDAYMSQSAGKVGTVTAKKLLPLISNPNSPAAQYFNFISDLSTDWNIRNVASRLGIVIPKNEEFFKSFNDFGQKLYEQYPLLFKIDSSTIINNDPNASYYTLKDDFAKVLADYINMVDRQNQVNAEPDVVI